MFNPIGPPVTYNINLRRTVERVCKWSAKVGAFTRFSDETAAPSGRLPEVWCATSMGQLSALRKGGYEKLEKILLGKWKREVTNECANVLQSLYFIFFSLH